MFTSTCRSPNVVDRALHQPARALEVGDVLAVGDRLAAHRADLVDDLTRGPGARSVAVDLGTEVVHHDLGALVRELECVAAADAAARAGHDDDASVADPHQRSP